MTLIDSALPPMPRTTSDFDFLCGTWRVHHRRRPEPLGPGSEWIDFDGVCVARTLFDGAVSVDEVSLHEPGYRGMSVRTYQPATGLWSIYWATSRSGELLLPPVVGRFADGVGTFEAVEVMDGRPVGVRFVWDEITATSARWRQAFSIDEGRAWDENWEMLFERISA
jgi:hypothetical protein